MPKRLPARRPGTLPTQVTENAETPGIHIGWETKADVMAAIPRMGRTPSESTVEKWSRLGVLPRSAQTWRRGQPGSVALYPPGTGAAVLAAANVYQSTRNPREIAWVLWRHGFPVQEIMWRSILESHARQFDKLVRRFLKRISDPDGEAMSIDGERLLARTKFARTRDTFFRRARKRLGPDFELFWELLVVILRGNFERWSPMAPPDVGPDDKLVPKQDRVKSEGEIERIAMAKGLGLPFRGKEINLRHSESDDLAEALSLVSRRLGGNPLTEVLASFPGAEIVQARNEWRALQVLSLVSVSTLSARKLAKQMGLEAFIPFASARQSKREAPLLLGLLALKQEAGIQDQINEIVAALRQIKASSSEVDLLRNFDPALYEILIV